MTEEFLRTGHDANSPDPTETESVADHMEEAFSSMIEDFRQKVAFKTGMPRSRVSVDTKCPAGADRGLLRSGGLDYLRFMATERKRRKLIENGSISRTAPYTRSVSLSDGNGVPLCAAHVR